MEFDPNIADSYNNRGLEKYYKKEYGAAIDDYTKAIELTPKFAMAYNNRGLAKYKKKEYDDAISDYTKAIELDPKCDLAYRNRGIAKKKKNDFVGACTDFDKAIAIDKKNPGSYNDKAWFLATCSDAKYRDGKGAIDLAKMATGINKSSQNLDTLAAAYAEAGMFPEAIKTQNDAIEMLENDSNGKDKIADYNKRLESYKAGNPWRD